MTNSNSHLFTSAKTICYKFSPPFTRKVLDCRFERGNDMEERDRKMNPGDYSEGYDLIMGRDQNLYVIYFYDGTWVIRGFTYDEEDVYSYLNYEN